MLSTTDRKYNKGMPKYLKNTTATQKIAIISVLLYTISASATLVYYTFICSGLFCKSLSLVVVYPSLSVLYKLFPAYSVSDSSYLYVLGGLVLFQACIIYLAGLLLGRLYIKFFINRKQVFVLFLAAVFTTILGLYLIKNHRSVFGPKNLNELAQLDGYDDFDSQRQSYISQQKGFSLQHNDVLENDLNDGWIEYIHKEAGFSVNYPSVLNASESGTWIGFGSKVVGDSLMGVTVYDKKSISLDSVVKNYGGQLGDDDENTETIVVNGVSAYKIVTTKAAYPGWYRVVIVVEGDDYIYSLSNGALMDAKLNALLKKIDPDFMEISYEEFYSSFRLL